MPLMLGKREARHDPRTVMLRSYVSAALPTIPPEVDWSKNAVYPMYQNDRWGCCGPAWAAHQIATWTTANSRPQVPTDADVLRDYSRLSGFDPNAGPPGMNPTDNGIVMLDMMKLWRREGLCGNHRIGAYAGINPHDHESIMAGTFLFLGVSLGVMLPLGVKDANEWRMPSRIHLFNQGQWAPGSWGGHAVGIVKYGPDGVWVVTWGKLLFVDWAFLDNYCDEAYCAVSGDYMSQGLLAPNGVALDKLLYDTQLLARQ